MSDKTVVAMDEATRETIRTVDEIRETLRAMDMLLTEVVETGESGLKTALEILVNRLDRLLGGIQ